MARERVTTRNGARNSTSARGSVKPSANSPNVMMLIATVSRRRVANPGRSARAQRRRDRSDRRLSGVELSQGQSQGASRGRRLVVGDCLREAGVSDFAAQTPAPSAAGAATNSIDQSGPRRRRRRGFGRRAPGYSAGVADTPSTGRAVGSASRRKRRQAIRMSRNSLTQALGARKCDANSRLVSSGTQ